MKSRNPNLDWMRKILADLERSRSDPQIAALMTGLNEPSPDIADAEPESFGSLPEPSDAPIEPFRRPGQ
jgi:hypothetical protein